MPHAQVKSCTVAVNVTAVLRTLVGQFNFGRPLPGSVLIAQKSYVCHVWNGWAKQYADSQFGTVGYMHAIFVADFVAPPVRKA